MWLTTFSASQLHSGTRCYFSTEIHKKLSVTKMVREKSKECHNHKPQPFPNPKRKRKPTNLNKHKPNKRTKSTKISSLFPKRGNRNAPDATLNTEIHKNSVRIMAPNSVKASKRKHKNQINHYNKQRRVLMANSSVCHSK